MTGREMFWMAAVTATGTTVVAGAETMLGGATDAPEVGKELAPDEASAGAVRVVERPVAARPLRERSRRSSCR